MISLHAASMGDSAKIVQKHLESILNIAAWICTDMLGMSNYAHNIVQSITHMERTHAPHSPQPTHTHVVPHTQYTHVVPHTHTHKA